MRARPDKGAPRILVDPTTGVARIVAFDGGEFERLAPLAAAIEELMAAINAAKGEE